MTSPARVVGYLLRLLLAWLCGMLICAAIGIEADPVLIFLGALLGEGARHAFGWAAGWERA